MEDVSIPVAKPVELSARTEESIRLIQLPPFLKPYKHTTCAYIASLIAVGTGFPLDSIKTRQQTYKYKNVWHCIVDTKKNEGIRGFYRGR
jgi:hypothetical protein